MSVMALTFAGNGIGSGAWGKSIRAGILILILCLWPSLGPGPSSQTKGIRISFWPPVGQKLILIPFVWLLGSWPGEGQRPGIRIRIPALNQTK